MIKPSFPKAPDQLLLLLFLLLPNLLLAQGRLVLIGGGSEVDGGWSDDPYSWGVAHAANQRVAVVTYDNAATQWIPDYFMNLGADTARNFIIDDVTTADAQSTYDSLMTYDAIFIKGGDQWQYISLYDNTRTEDAIRETYQQGGVIMGTSAGMAILSKVDFTAENGTVYPEEALEDPYNTYMQLDSTFLPLMDGTIFDTHFVQRGRFGRMLGFLGRMEMDLGKRLLGIGVDDRTAFCIDTGDTGIAMGSGAVNLYKGGQLSGNFQTNGQKLVTGGFNVKTAQLLDSCSMALGPRWESSNQVQGLDLSPITDLRPKPSQRQVFLSGSDVPAMNEDMVEGFLQKSWVDTVDDTIAVVTANADLSKADSMEQRLEQNGAHEASVVRATPSMSDDPGSAQIVRRAEGLFFVNSLYDSLMNTLGQGALGTALRMKIDSPTLSKAFMGSDARLAGASFVRYYDSSNASFYHDLEFETGLRVMEGTIIIPRCFDPNASIENAAASVPYGMLKDSLWYGVQIPEENYAHYHQLNWSLGLDAYGPYPLPVWKYPSGRYGFASDSLNSSGLPRQITGFQRMQLALADSANPAHLKGLSGIVRRSSARETEKLELIQNPVQSDLRYINRSESKARYRILTPRGRILERGVLQNGQGAIELSGLHGGTYLLNYRTEDGHSGAERFIKE